MKHEIYVRIGQGEDYCLGKVLEFVPTGVLVELFDIEHMELAYIDSSMDSDVNAFSLYRKLKDDHCQQIKILGNTEFNNCCINKYEFSSIIKIYIFNKYK